MHRTLKLEIKGTIATVALNRPDARNAMSAALMRKVDAGIGAHAASHMVHDQVQLAAASSEARAAREVFAAKRKKAASPARSPARGRR
jgi:enoyl-CoA hydratase/carnithine racemase